MAQILPLSSLPAQPTTSAFVSSIQPLNPSLSSFMSSQMLFAETPAESVDLCAPQAHRMIDRKGSCASLSIRLASRSLHLGVNKEFHAKNTPREASTHHSPKRPLQLPRKKTMRRISTASANLLASLISDENEDKTLDEDYSAPPPTPNLARLPTPELSDWKDEDFCVCCTSSRKRVESGVVQKKEVEKMRINYP